MNILKNKGCKVNKVDYDVIIIGAGPGGSNAATFLLNVGMKVAQLDRYKFPRVKPCAGGLTIKSIKACLQNIEPMIQLTSNELEFNLWNREKSHFILNKPILKMISRPDFDFFMIQHNLQQKSFTFYENKKVDKIDYKDKIFRIQSNKLCITSRHLIGADGVYGITNRIFKVNTPLDYALGIEANIHNNNLLSNNINFPIYDFGAIPKGYGWVFPKKDHSSVGFYTFEKKIPQIRALLLSYIRSKNFLISEDNIKYESHYIPVGGFNITIPEMPVYIVGDAGSFADALTGEGIYHALESGRLAAETIYGCESGNNRHELYYRKIKKRILIDTELSYLLSRKYYKNIDKGFRLLNKAYVWRPLIQGSADGCNYYNSSIYSLYYYLKSFLNVKHRRSTYG